MSGINPEFLKQAKIAIEKMLENEPMSTNDSVVVSILGHEGRMLSGSKTLYSQKHPESKVFFNANIYGSKAQKLWFGDIDLTLESAKLQEVANKLGERIYVTREQPFRFQKVTTCILNKENDSMVVRFDVL